MQTELTAISYLGSMQWGITSPRLVRANDGQLYVVKLCGNKMGVRALANEGLAAILGAKIGLCFPPSARIWLDKQLLQRNRSLQKAALVEGPHFACRYLSRTSYVSRFELDRAINRKEMAGVMLFDQLLHNTDRTNNRKNLLIRYEKEGHRIYAIDHSHLFRNGRWTPESLQLLAQDVSVSTRRVYGLLLKHYLQPSDFTYYGEMVKALTNEELAGVVGAIPELWLPDAGERQALIHHLCIRRNLVDDVIAAIVSIIPANRQRK